MELENKVINFLGDSITEGVGVKDIKNNRFDHVLMEMANLKATNNYGISGSRLAHQSVPSANPRFDLCFSGRLYNMDKNADIIVMYGGVNDYLHGDAYFGSEEDTTPATFCGAVNYITDAISKNYKNAKFVVLTPAHVSRIPGDDLPSQNPIKKPDAKPLVEYVDYIKKVCEKKNIPYIDMYRNPDINTLDPEIRAKYSADGLHFNDEGHHYIAKMLKEFLEQL